MPDSQIEKKLLNRFVNVAVVLVFLGVAFIVWSSYLDENYSHTSFHTILERVGEIFLVVGTLQWFFDNHLRANFFEEVRLEIVGNERVAKSGICDFLENSRDANFRELFLSSKELAIGVNYSPRLIDNTIELIKERTKKRKKTTIFTIDKDSYARDFLKNDYPNASIDEGLARIDAFLDEFDANRKFVNILRFKTVLRYNFIKFDSRIWIVVGTNGLGRRPVPGFFVSIGSSWFEHFRIDIEKLMEGRCE